MRRTSIVITAPWAERLGGAEKMLWMFLRHLDRRRISPLVVFFQPGPFEKEVSVLDIPTVVVPTGRLRQVNRTAFAIWRLTRLLRRNKPDLLLNWSAKTQLYGGAAALLAGMGERVVWWQHGISKGHWIDRLASGLPARAVGCSSYAAAAVQEKFPPRRRTFVVHPGIEAPRVLTDSQLRKLRIRLCIPADKAVVGMVGRMQPDRGHDRVLRALAGLRNRGFDVHGLVVGGNAFNLSPGYESYLRRLADDLGLSESVTFAGQVSDATPFIQLMRVLVVASIGESFGIALLEGMALGVPVVAFEGAGPAEIVESESSGLLVPSADEAALGNAVERLLSDSELHRRLGGGGRRRFESHFEVDRMTERMVATLVAESRGTLEPVAART
jgi:glycosyltransferase involved in cell wall biosynthesis